MQHAWPKNAHKTYTPFYCSQIDEQLELGLDKLSLYFAFPILLANLCQLCYCSIFLIRSGYNKRLDNFIGGKGRICCMSTCKNANRKHPELGK